MTLLLKLLKFSIFSKETVEKILEKKHPLQIDLLSLLAEKGFEGVYAAKLNEILQVNILLITNYMVTFKAAFQKEKKVYFFIWKKKNQFFFRKSILSFFTN